MTITLHSVLSFITSCICIEFTKDLVGLELPLGFEYRIISRVMKVEVGMTCMLTCSIESSFIVHIWDLANFMLTIEKLNIASDHWSVYCLQPMNLCIYLWNFSCSFCRYATDYLLSVTSLTSKLLWHESLTHSCQNNYIYGMIL